MHFQLGRSCSIQFSPWKKFLKNGSFRLATISCHSLWDRSQAILSERWGQIPCQTVKNIEFHWEQKWERAVGREASFTSVQLVAAAEHSGRGQSYPEGVTLWGILLYTFCSRINVRKSMMNVNKCDTKHHSAAFKYILSTRLRKATTLLKSLQQFKKKNPSGFL